MKYLIVLLALFVTGCGNSPVSFEARVVGLKQLGDENTTTEVYSSKHGIVLISNSPYFKLLKIENTVSIGCGDSGRTGVSYCRILSIKEPAK